MMGNNSKTCKVAITGASGLVGFHLRALIHSVNLQHEFEGFEKPFEVINISREMFDCEDALAESLKKSDVVFHLAGINRASVDEVEFGNISLAQRLINALEKANSSAHIIFSNSIQAMLDNPYGRGKNKSAELLTKWAEKSSSKCSDVMLPHIFGERAKPFYNTVTATLCRQIHNGEDPTINNDAHVELLHAGEAAEFMLEKIQENSSNSYSIPGNNISVEDLYKKLLSYKDGYEKNHFPDLTKKFDVQLFNTFRELYYPNYYPRTLDMHVDGRGHLFEAVKGGGGGQTFLSSTKPGVERGNHFHRYKVERFLVLSGSAEIKLRSIFSDHVEVIEVSGDEPTFVDIPTLHTHNIKNIGRSELLTLFWAHEIFDPNSPDTYAENV